MGPSPAHAVSESSETCQTLSSAKLDKVTPIKDEQNWRKSLDESLSKKEIVTHEDARVEEEKISGLEVEKDGHTYFYVATPLKYGSILSNLTAVYSEAGNLITYSETLVKELSRHTFERNIYLDGRLMNNEVSDVAYVSNSNLQQQIDNLTTRSVDAKKHNVSGKIVGCLASLLGVNAVIAWAIYSACAGSCATGVVPICVACIGAIATVASGDFKVVTECFKH